MKFSAYPLKASHAAQWLVKRSEDDLLNTEEALEIIQSQIACGLYEKAIVFTNGLKSKPELFAKCAITLLQSLCEHQHAVIARKEIPRLTKNFQVGQHEYRVTDLFLAIAETTNCREDIINAKNSILAELDPSERALRHIRLAKLDPTEVKRLKWISAHILSLLPNDLLIAFRISLALTEITQHESDLLTLCSIAEQIALDTTLEKFGSFFDEIFQIGESLPKKVVEHALSKQSSGMINYCLSLILYRKGATYSESLH